MTKKQLEQAAKTLGRGLQDEQWRNALHAHMESESFQQLAWCLQQDREAGAVIYPPTNTEIFAALNCCPLDRVRVVLLGQDPYPSPGHAHGLAFSVRRHVRPLPASLRNIFKELQDEGLVVPPQDGGGSQRQHGNLQKWADQGVLMLNTILTVREGAILSHEGLGWEKFTDAVIQAVLDYSSSSSEDHDGGSAIVFLLWGNPATKKLAEFLDLEDPNSHYVILRCSHPSPLSASRTERPFLGSNCFRRVNQALEEMGEDPIDWNVNE